MMTSVAEQQAHYIRSLRLALKQAADEQALYRAIVDAPFASKVNATFYFLGIVVLLLVNEASHTIDRVALSDTEFAERTKEVSVVPFEQIRIPLQAEGNAIAAAIRTGKSQVTTDWKELFSPTMKADFARINQANAGIACSFVYPFTAREGGALIYSYFQYFTEIGQPQRDFMQAYTQLVNQRLNTQPAGED